MKVQSRKNWWHNQYDFQTFDSKVITNIVLKFDDNRLKEGELQGGQFGEFSEKVWLRKNGEANWGFAKNDITNIVLKFGDNRTKRRGVTEGGEFVENLRKSN